MQKVLIEIPVPGAFSNGHQDTIRIGESQWDKDTLSVKYCWRDKNGKVARGGEMPLAALPIAQQAVLELL